jgi:hypothetical protein
MPAAKHLGALSRRFFDARLRTFSRNDEEYLFRSPANAERLMRAYNDSLAGKGEPFTIEQLREEFGLGKK